MTLLHRLSKLNLKTNNGPFVFSLLIFSFLGFLDAMYLTIIHYKHVIPPCSIARGCEAVLTSHYATFFGIPLAILGVAFYSSVIILTMIFLQRPGEKTFIPLIIAGKIGIIVSAILFYIQAVVLHAFCQYCLASEGVTIVIAITILIKYVSAREAIIEEAL